MEVYVADYGVIYVDEETLAEFGFDPDTEYIPAGSDAEALLSYLGLEDSDE